MQYTYTYIVKIYSIRGLKMINADLKIKKYLIHVLNMIFLFIYLCF